jgi:hypothetical protein
VRSRNITFARAGEGRSARPSLAVLPLALAVMLVVSGFGGTATTTKLAATVRPCGVLRADGSTQQLRHGRFMAVIRDTSSTRYFALRGPGVRKSTGARYVGTARWALRLQRGTYHYRCGLTRLLRGTLVVA